MQKNTLSGHQKWLNIFCSIVLLLAFSGDCFCAPLCEAIQKNDQADLLKLLRAPKFDPNEYDDQENDTPLEFAIRHNQPWAAEMLLMYGANPNQYSKQKKSTPVMNAISSHKEWALHLLLDNGADPTTFLSPENDDYRTPLFFAVSNG
jgi:ankyrin repeat protein